jgi:uridine kinase
MSAQTYLIGIAGPSGAGKSYLASHLAERLHAPVLALDHYYRDLSQLPLVERAQTNFDEPTALEHDLLIAQIGDLRQGRAINVPIYDFSVHTRTCETQFFQPSEFVIIEGLFTLHWPELRHHLGTGVYVDMTDDICLERRRERDVRERARTPESVIEQFQTTVAPMAERYVRPTRAHADVVVFGAMPIADEIERVFEHVRRNLRQSVTQAETDRLLQPAHSLIPTRCGAP